jgi:hypothetical protein
MNISPSGETLITVRRRTRLVAGMTIAGALLFTAACGGDKGGSGAGTPSGSAAADPMAAYRQCLEKQGVTLPTGGGGGRRPSGAPTGRPSGAPSGVPGGRPSGFPSGRPSMSAAQQQAIQACASLAPQGRPAGQGGGPFGGAPGNGGNTSG